MSFLGIKIPEDTSKLLHKIKVPGEKTSLEDYHISLLIFKDNFPMKHILKATETSNKIISKINPISITLKTVNHFPKREDAPCPIICLIESDDLQKLHKKLVKAFDQNKIPFEKTFKDYKPHITLSYANKEIDDFDIKPLKFESKEVTLWSGDMGLNLNKLYVTIPFGQTKHSEIIQKIDIMCKFAAY